MTLDTATNVEEIRQVQNADGEKVTPATGAFVHQGKSGADLAAEGDDTVSVELAKAPDRAQKVKVHVDGWDNPGAVEIHFEDSDRNAVTKRTEADSADYNTDDADGTAGTNDVFVVTDVVSPWISVHISTDGAANTVNYNIMVV